MSRKSSSGQERSMGFNGAAGIPAVLSNSSVSGHSFVHPSAVLRQCLQLSCGRADILQVWHSCRRPSVFSSCLFSWYAKESRIIRRGLITGISGVWVIRNASFGFFSGLSLFCFCIWEPFSYQSAFPMTDKTFHLMDSRTGHATSSNVNAYPSLSRHLDGLLT